MKKICFIFLAAALFWGKPATAQKEKDDKEDNKTLFTVGGDPVTVGEFKYIYEKNNSGDEKSKAELYTAKSIDDYLALYKNFKLKVKEAEAEGMDTSAKFISEYKNYRNQLAQPYLNDKEVTQDLIDEAYDRMKWELKASHILITVAPDASPKDTLAAWNKIDSIYKAIQKGADFADMAVKYSGDPSAKGAKGNKGDLGYFTVFQMIYPFESAAYKIKNVGDVSKPFRTRFGYHIIKLTDKRPYRGEMLARHILIVTSEKYTDKEQNDAKKLADSVYRMLKRGGNFEELAKKYSGHSQTAENGGLLPRFTDFTSNLPMEFKDTAFGLKHDGDYSHPFRTLYGYHIVQRVELKPLQPEKDMEEYIKQKISKDGRSEKSREAAIAHFKKEDHYKENEKALKDFIAMVDTSLLNGHWKAVNKAGDDELFSIEKEKYSQKDFANWLVKNEKKQYNNVDYAVKQYYDKYSGLMVTDYEDNNLENKYPEFRNVAKEYKEGILLFDVTDKYVWTKAMQDTLGLEKFFELNQDKYKWKTRAEAQILTINQKPYVDSVKQQLKAGKDLNTISATYLKRNIKSMALKEGAFEKGENRFVDTTGWAIGMHDLGDINGSYYMVSIKGTKPPQDKKLSEVKGVVISDYQDYLEKQWLAGLSKKYEIKVDDYEVKKLIKK